MAPSDDASVLDSAVQPSQAVIEAIADAEGVDVTAIEPPAYAPLYAVIDPEALDALFTRRHPPDDTTCVSFEYAGYHVVVSGNGQVSVTPQSDTDRTDSPDTVPE